jgi:adenylate cyclase
MSRRQSPQVGIGPRMSDPIAVSRKLVAVFAADVEGYSRLMGLDEVGTLEGLTERRAILDRIIGDHRGRIANTAGDSVLAEFGSAVEAVQCAVDAQNALAETNAGVSPDKHINFRIGVHIGDVMVRAGDLFGDGVNIAARLQTLAKPGTVCISGVTYDQVRKVLPMTFVDLGVQQVKNIQEPIGAYEVGAQSETREAAPARVAEAESPPPLPDKPSIAVLPFENMTGDPEQEYFADGMVEEIITALSRFKWLFVIARNSSFTFKGKAVDVKEVGRRLGVRYVLEGSVRKAAGKVRITGQLIDAVTGTHIWADRFERDLTDIFALQDEVTLAVVSAIQPKLLQTEIAMATRRRPENLTAYDCYLRARQQYYLATREGLAEAIRLAHRALVRLGRGSGRCLSHGKRRFRLCCRSSIRPQGGSSAFSLGVKLRRW